MIYATLVSPGCTSLVEKTLEIADTFLELCPTAEVGHRGVKWVDQPSGSPIHALRRRTGGMMQKHSPRKVHIRSAKTSQLPFLLP